MRKILLGVIAVMVMSAGAFAGVEEFRTTDPEFAEFFSRFAGVEVPAQSKLDPAQDTWPSSQH